MIKKGVVSIIVPVYKTEVYLRKCIESICGQSYDKLEILLIDDGSPDMCPMICDEYAERDKRIRVIHKKNAGVSAARNTGIAEATGEYITFVDSDDWLETEMYEKMMNVAVKYNCDIIMCDCIKEKGSEAHLFSHKIRSGYYNHQQLQDEYYRHLLMMENVEFPPTISNWLCMFRQKPLNDLFYIEGIRYSEDLLFGAQMMYCATSFYYMKGEALYHYQIRDDSASHRYDNNAWEDHEKLCKAAADYFLKIDKAIFGHQIDLMWLYFIYNTVGETLKEPSLGRKQKIQISKKILATEEVRNVFNRLNIIELPISLKLKVRTICYKYMVGLDLFVK